MDNKRGEGVGPKFTWRRSVERESERARRSLRGLSCGTDKSEKQYTVHSFEFYQSWLVTRWNVNWTN